MKFTGEMIEKLDKNYSKKRKDSEYKTGLGLSVENSGIMNEAIICKCGLAICSLDELSQLIYELEDLRETVKETAGIVC